MHRVIADFLEFCQRFFQFPREDEKEKCVSVEFLGSLSIFDVFKSLASVSVQNRRE